MQGAKKQNRYCVAIFCHRSQKILTQNQDDALSQGALNITKPKQSLEGSDFSAISIKTKHEFGIDPILIRSPCTRQMPRLSLAAASRLRGNPSSFYRSVVPRFIDDDDDRTQKNVDGVMNYATLYNHFSSTPFMLNRKREYHSTSRTDILPFIAIGFLGATAVYTYRTLKQMDKEWDDYYDALAEYKAATGSGSEKASATDDELKNRTSSHHIMISSHFTGGTLAIDLGTSALKLSHRQSNNNDANKKGDPSIVVDREGFRSTPALVWVGEHSDDGAIVGRLAQARSFDTKGGFIICPRLAMNNSNNDNELVMKATRETIHAAAANALEQILGGGRGVGKNSDEPLFVLDSTMATKGSYNVRPIFSYPSLGEDESKYLACYRNAINDLSSPAGIASFVAEPIAAITGAEHYNLLPLAGSEGQSVLVIDVGGQSTSISLVSGDKEKVLHSTSLPFGGDTFIDALVSHLIRNFDGFQHDSTGGDSSEDDHSSLLTKPTLSDKSALQRLYEASTHAVHELSSKTRSEINVPYLTMDLATRQPKHLEVGVARTVVESEVQTFISKSLVPCLKNGDALSGAFPTPSTLSALFSSTIMSTLEKTSTTPYNLRAIMLIGGGGRIPLVRNSLKNSVAVLAGDAYASDRKRLVLPEGDLCNDMIVTGAALWGSLQR
jgi:hypothetical protein